mgnify:CR=1 FL=1
MRKIFLVLGAVLIVSGLSASVSAQTTGNQYPTKPADAATINDIQGQVRGGYFQENGLRQDAGGVSQNPNGAANILKNSNDQQKIVVVGALPDATVNNDKNVPWFGLVIFLAVMLAPLVLILNMLKKANEQKKALATTGPVSVSELETNEVSVSKVAVEEATEEAEATTEAKLEEVSEEKPLDNTVEETVTPETEKPVVVKAEKKSIPKKPKKHKKKSKKGKKKKK